MSFKGYGKLLLLGEYSVLFGSPALGIRLPEYLELEETGGEIPKEEDSLQPFKEWLHRNCPDLPDIRGRRFRISGNLPPGRGFGSSAALCTALARVLDPGEKSPDRLNITARRCEDYFHGHSSGIDTALSLHQGLSLFYPRPRGGWERRQISMEGGFLLAGSLERTVPARESIERIRTLKTRKNSAESGWLEELTEWSRRILRCPGNRLSLEEFTEGVSGAQKLLDQLGLVLPSQREFLEWGQSAGALTGKISGAGQGGAWFLVLSTEEAAIHCRGILQNRGIQNLMLLPLGSLKTE